MRNIASVTLIVGATAFSLLGSAQAQDKPAPAAAPAPASAQTMPQKEAAKPIYDEKADAKKQIAAALAQAKMNHRRVLVQWGGNWCGWCVKLHELCSSDEKIKHELLFEYEVVHVDAGRPDGKNVDLAASYGADVKKNGFPFLTILDSDGTVVVNQETSSLELADKSKMGHDPKRVLDFLTDHQAEAPDANALFQEALSRARQEDKRVFLRFGAPTCVWCRRFDAWMIQPEVAAALSKDFVDLSIDLDRFQHATNLLARYNVQRGGGTPWFALLDADGKVLADSSAPGGNIGFPQSADELAWLQSMLKKAAVKLTEADIKSLIAGMTPKPETTTLQH